ncbi:MAG: RNA polymerase sigma factor [Steroidobacteraceae bacterium]
MPGVLPRLRRFARTLARSPHDADDLAQNTIERALARAAQWRPPAAGASPEQLEVAVRSWMFGIMKNAWIDDRRAHGRERAVVTQDEALVLGAAEDSAHALEERLSLEAAMERLPDEQRLAIALVLVEGLSYQEAADLLQIPQGTLTSRLHRGREALTRQLASAEASR